MTILTAPPLCLFGAAVAALDSSCGFLTFKLTQFSHIFLTSTRVSFFDVVIARGPGWMDGSQGSKSAHLQVEVDNWASIGHHRTPPSSIDPREE